MPELQINSDIDIVKKNLLDLDKRQSDLFEIRRALIKELSDSICLNKELTFEIVKERYRDIFSDANFSEKYFDALSLADRVELCSFLSKSPKLNRAFEEVLLGENEKCDADAIGKVAYMKNNYTDQAYLTFSKVISSPRSSYHSSFQAVCEEVYSGTCEYCILPIENSNDGKLMTFYSMIDKYELKINYICTVYHSNGQGFTKFALLKKSFSISGIFNASQAYLSKRSLEIRVSELLKNDSPLFNILSAAELCSLKLQRIDSLPLTYNEDLLGYYVVFSISQSDLKTFLMYLSLEYPQSYLMGVYLSVN